MNYTMLRFEDLVHLEILDCILEVCIGRKGEFQWREGYRLPIRSIASSLGRIQVFYNEYRMYDTTTRRWVDAFEMPPVFIFNRQRAEMFYGPFALESGDIVWSLVSGSVVFGWRIYALNSEPGPHLQDRGEITRIQQDFMVEVTMQ